MYLENEYLRTNSISSSLCVLQHLQLICYQVHSSLYFCGYFFSFLFAFYYLTLSRVSWDVLYVNLTYVFLDGWLTPIAYCPVQLLSQSWNIYFLQICSRRGPKQPLFFCIVSAYQVNSICTYGHTSRFLCAR